MLPLPSYANCHRRSRYEPGKSASEGRRVWSVAVTPSTEKLLALRSGGVCAFPGCVRVLYADATTESPAKVRGQIAHIEGSKPGSPRYNPDMPDAESDGIDNLVFLCRDHHADIDNQPESYPPEVIRDFKREHEATVSTILARELAELNFPELAAVCDAFKETAASVAADSSFLLTPVAEKVAKNDLLAVADDIRLGASRVTVVREFIEQRAKLDATFVEKLRFGFMQLYASYRYEGRSSVDTYLDLVAYARRYAKSYAAPLAIVYTLFEACDIFEK